MNLHASELGTGAVDVVFLHGLFGQGKNWTTIARGVADLTTSHLLDLPNHGRSPWTPTFTLDDQTDAVAAWFERFGHPVAVVGHSLGGKIAMRLALRYPHLVERLMVVDISPVRNELRSGFAPLVDAMRAVDLESLASRSAADEQMAPRVPDPIVRGFLLQNLRRQEGGWQWACNLGLLGDSLTEVGSWPEIDATYTGAVYWVHGGRSPYVRSEHRAPMRALFPKVVAVGIKDAGHWVHSEAPEAFSATLRHFLTGAAG